MHNNNVVVVDMCEYYKSFIMFLRMSTYNISPQSGQVVFGQLLGMADYVSSPLGKCICCRLYSLSELTAQTLKVQWISKIQQFTLIEHSTN